MSERLDISCHLLLQPAFEVTSIIISILQVRKLSLGEDKEGHVASEWQSLSLY